MVNKKELSFLNQLTSEILILDDDLNIIWLNYAALNKGWILNNGNKKSNLITDQLSDETNIVLVKLFKSAIGKNISQTKRDFELIDSKMKKREIDITVRWSNTYKFLIVEILSLIHI